MHADKPGLYLHDDWCCALTADEGTLLPFVSSAHDD